DGGLFAHEGFTATGEVCANGAHIKGQLNLPGAQLSNPDGIALALDGATIDGGVFAHEGFTATGQVCANGAHIKG
ncbi:hypothetical protein O4159_24405, partial [Gordonia terrae]|nr:hypothetical protein [Gordonia terrae]